MAKHSQGPWVATGWKGVVVNDANGNTIALMPGGGNDLAVIQANAKLIAASTELLAALQRAVPWLGKLIADGGHMNSVAPNDAVGALQQAEAAIAKALK